MPLSILLTKEIFGIDFDCLNFDVQRKSRFLLCALTYTFIKPSPINCRKIEKLVFLLWLMNQGLKLARLVICKY